MTDLTLEHDDDLEKMSTPEARTILDHRSRGASTVRVVLARMYGDSHRATAQGWHIVPHVTERGTIGVVDVANGTAWDSMVAAEDDVMALGVDDQHTPDGNHPSLAGDVAFDGELVQRLGEDPKNPISAPAGWRRLGLPTWRGFNGGDGHSLVPPELYTPDQQIQPQLRAVGLVTCYGERGLPRTTLEDAHGHKTDNTRPQWVHPDCQSPTIEGIPLPTDLQSAVREVASAFLRDCIRHVMRGAEIEKKVKTALAKDDRSALWKLLNPERDGRDAETAQCALKDDDGEVARSALPDTTRFACRVLAVTGVGPDTVGGTNLPDLLIDAIEYITLQRTAKARGAIFRTLKQYAKGRNIYMGDLPGALGPMARSIAEWITDELPSDFDEKILATLYRDGPIYLDQPAAIYQSPD